MVAIRHGTLTARRVPEQPPAAMKRHRVLLSATIWSSHHRLNAVIPTCAIGFAEGREKVTK
jgi:hypothetical protein